MYGYLNETFRTEFLNIAQDVKSLCIKSGIRKVFPNNCCNRRESSQSKNPTTKPAIELNLIENNRISETKNGQGRIEKRNPEATSLVIGPTSITRCTNINQFNDKNDNQERHEVIPEERSDLIMVEQPV